MSGKVYNRFKILLAEKETKEGIKYPYEKITRATGIAGSTLSSWASNKVKRFDADTIATLCNFFNCDLKDLIIYERD